MSTHNPSAFQKFQRAGFFTALTLLSLLAASNSRAVAPTNDVCSSAVSLSDGFTYTLEDTSGATDDSVPSLVTIAKGVWFTYTPTITGIATIDTCPSDFDTMIEVVGGCGATNSVAFDDDDGPVCPGSGTGASGVQFFASSNTTYYICAGAYSGSGNLQIKAHTDALTGLITLANGATAAGQLNSTLQTNSYTFYGEAGDSVQITGAAETSSAHLVIRDPYGNLVPPTTKLSYTGNYLVTLGGGLGKCGVGFARIPGAFGPSGGLVEGGLVMSSFNANAGDMVAIHIASQTFAPKFNVYNPNGVALGGFQPSGPFAPMTGDYASQVTQSGQFVIVVTSGFGLDYSSYSLSVNVTPGSQNVKMNAVVISGNSLSLSASGGLANKTYVIYSSTNLSSWTPFLTNQFDDSGNAATSNLLDPAQPLQYFRLSVP